MRTIDTPEAERYPASARHNDAPWESVLRALENERCLDLHYRIHSTRLPEDSRIPNYKVMKQIALCNRLGIAYRPFIAVVQVLLPLIGMAQWLAALAAAVLHRGRSDAPTLHVIATTPNNAALIESSLADGSTEGSLPRDTDLMRLRRLASGVGVAGVLRGFVTHMRLLGHILGLAGDNRRDLLLHSRDAVALILLTHYARMRPAHNFVTDDHYQRWAYLLSHNSSHLSIVQHGFLDDAIAFKHPFGTVQRLYVRDVSFVPYFSRYYEVPEHRVFTPVRSLDPNPYSANGVFLASSFPSIDMEIELVKSIKQRSDVPIIVKFHPSHHYDERKQVLSSLASHVCMADEYPQCAVFVSHSSFMEYDYRAFGVTTVSIARCDGAGSAVAAILSCLLARTAGMREPVAPIPI